MVSRLITWPKSSQEPGPLYSVTSVNRSEDWKHCRGSLQVQSFDENLVVTLFPMAHAAGLSKVDSAKISC